LLVTGQLDLSDNTWMLVQCGKHPVVHTCRYVLVPETKGLKSHILLLIPPWHHVVMWPINTK